MCGWPTRRCGSGPPPAAESYLVVERVLEAARRTGAAAVHPGYGFLSESAAFARAVRDAGLIFVGPPPEAMERLGGKDSAKALLAPAGVPLVPGYHGADQADARLRDEAERIGFPLLIKAAAGGGGKGMRRVDAAGGLPRRAGRLPARGQGGVRRRPGAARAADRPAAPCRGAGVRRPARQRRAPVRARLHAAAPAPEDHRGGAGTRPRARDARGAGPGRHRCGAGRRLRERRHGRVPARPGGRLLLHRDEHAAPGRASGDRGDHRPGPGRVAAARSPPASRCRCGRRRSRAAATPSRRGSTPRTRPGASCPRSAGCAPCACPTGLDGVRVDTGVEEGDAVTPYYDPMIAKIIAHGADRAAALERLAAALDATQVEGVTTNLAFLRAAAGSPSLPRDARSTPAGSTARAREALAAEPPADADDAAAGRAGDRGAEPRPAGAAAACRAPTGPRPGTGCDAWRLNQRAARAGPAARRRGAAHRHRRGHAASASPRRLGDDASCTRAAASPTAGSGSRATAGAAASRPRSSATR